MSHDTEREFIQHLQRLHGRRDLGALATLRHSLTFAPGAHHKAYPYVERYVGREWRADDPRRLSRYAVAGLFAMQPTSHPRSLATALGELMRDKQRPSLELRFLALLEADADGVMNHLRQAMSLLAADGRGCDHAGLLADMRVMLDDYAAPEWRDRLKQRWARDFYRALQAEGGGDPVEPSAPAPTPAPAATIE